MKLTTAKGLSDEEISHYLYWELIEPTACVEVMSETFVKLVNQGEALDDAYERGFADGQEYDDC